MQTLHIVTPSHISTPMAFFGLMRLSQQHFNGSHHVIVIGDQTDAVYLQKMGMPILGYVDGYIDTSRTLARRVRDLIRSITTDYGKQIIAWGWHATSVASAIDVTCDILAVVDEIDQSCSLACTKLTIIPTSWTCSAYLRTTGVPESVITEPLVGVNPTTLVVDGTVAKDMMSLQKSELIIGIVGKVCSWKEVVSMAVRLRAAHIQADFIVLPCYQYLSQLISAAKQHGVLDMLHDTPSTLRTHDIVNIADGMWAPSIAPHTMSCGVLDIVSIAWENVPLAICEDHPVAGVPTVGKHLAWARDEFEVSGWLLDLAKYGDDREQQSADVTTRIRSIASPSRFVEGIQMRM